MLIGNSLSRGAALVVALTLSLGIGAPANAVNGGTADPASPVTVGAPQAVFAGEGTNSISGQATDPLGQPASGVRVLVSGLRDVPLNYNYAYNNSPGIFTDASGNYTLSGLPDGVYTVSFQGGASGGKDLASMEWPGVRWFAGDDIVVRGGQALTGFDIQLEYSNTVEVAVSSPGRSAEAIAPYVDAVLYYYDDALADWVRVTNGGWNPAYSSEITFFGLIAGYYAVDVEYFGPGGYSLVQSDVLLVEGGTTTQFDAVLRINTMADFSGDGVSDVLVRDNVGGLYLYAGNGSGGWSGSGRIGTGWNGFNRVFRVGDFSGDGCADVMGRTPNGDLYLYRGNCAGGWLGATRIGVGWGIFTEIIGVGDFSGDSFADVMARTANGDLYLYRGNGVGGWSTSGRIGTGWNVFTTVFGAGDFSGDGVPDVMGRTASGDLFLYRGNGASGWSGSGRIGTGWSVFTAVFSPGDFSGDGIPDVMGRTAGGDLFLYRGNGSGGWGTSGRIGTGWGPLSFVT